MTSTEELKSSIILNLQQCIFKSFELDVEIAQIMSQIKSLSGGNVPKIVAKRKTKAPVKTIEKIKKKRKQRPSSTSNGIVLRANTLDVCKELLIKHKLKIDILKAEILNEKKAIGTIENRLV